MNRIIVFALMLFCMILQIEAQTLSEEEVTAQMYQAFELNKDGKKAEALELFLIVGENTMQQRNEGERQVYVCSQTMACQCYELLGRYKEGYLLGKSLLQGKLNDTERKDVSHLYAMNGYMYACEFIQRDEKGRADYKRGRELISEILPYSDGQVKEYAETKIPLSWYFEGAQYAMTQSYDEALSSYEKALNGFRDLGRVSEEVDVLSGIASVKAHLCKFDEAKRVYYQAFVLANQNGKVNKQMDVLRELWSLGNTTGDMKLIRSTSASMDSLVEKAGDAKMKFAYYHQKGDEAKSKGQYKLAEKWYIKGKELAEGDNKDPFAASKHLAYNKLRNLYIATGQYDDAIAYGRKVLEEYQKQINPEEDAYYLPYSMMADIYRLKGDRDNCFACIDSLFVGESRMKEPRELCQMYMVRARCHNGFKEYSAALADYKKADEILASKYPQTEENRIMLLASMGGTEHRLDMYDESEKHYKLYADYTKQLYGEKSMEYINALMILANAEGFSKHLDAGCTHYTDAAFRLKELMKKRIPMMSVEERESLWSLVSSLFTMMTPYAIEANRYQDAFTESCYDALVMSKSFLLESERSLFDVVKKEGTDDDMKGYMLLTLMKKQIKEWEKDYARHADSILSMSQRAERLAVRLAERCRSIGNITRFMDIDYAAVKSALKPNEVLLDFTDYVSETVGRKYAAYIINKKDEYPLVKYLFAERQIDSLGITRPDMFYNQDYAQDVLKLLWEPLKANIAEGSTVYYVPSQLLFQVSLESLPLADGSLLGSHYDFVRLSSARELVKAQSPVLAFAPHSAVLYGGLQYDIQPTAMVEEAKKYDLTDLLVMRGDMVRGDSVFCELPGSKQEIMQIESLLKANKWKVTPRMRMEGTEESFLSMHGKAPQLLQIASHGFYYTPERAVNVDYLKGYSDAMMLSGIVLSGGNAAWRGMELPDGVLGGILTANNIARLDLSGTEMVVLSACQSGQGKATSEGLYGLQRAFKKAGVGTMVMALWNVSDKVATEFMTTFYEQLASKQCNWNKRQAFERTKSIIREKYPDPFHWAAFVMLD